MPVSRILVVFCAAALVARAVPAAPVDAPVPGDQTDGGTPFPGALSPVVPAPTVPPVAAPAPGATPSAAALNPEEFKREVMEEVRRELDKEKADLRQEIQFTESEADARNYDAEQLKELKETVNLLQLHGYLRIRGNLFVNGDLGTGPVTTGPLTGHTLFPAPQGDSSLGVADMRLRLNPVIRVSDRIAVYSQIDVLDNAVLGGNPQAEPFFDVSGAAIGAPILSSQILETPVMVQRAWAEIQTPVGVFSFGRMPFHFGEGMVYNDGNCLDCDFGTTFDRLQLTSIPFLGGHLFTLAGDYLTEGVTTNPSATAVAIPTQQLSTGYRFSLQFTKVVPPLELKRRLDNNEWVVQYGALGAYRVQPWETVQSANGTPNGSIPANTSNEITPLLQNPTMSKLGAQFGEGDAYFQAMHGGLRLSAEVAVFGGLIADRLGTPTNPSGQALTAIQEAAVARAQYAFLKQNALILSFDLGYASGDNDNNGNMGARPGTTPGTSNPAELGIVDGPTYNCTNTSCTHATFNNFRLNPDFHIDQLLWRNIFTDITNAYFARVEGRYKLFGRASGGGEDDGFEFGLSIVYSQAVFLSATPAQCSGKAACTAAAPLGVEFDPSITYTSHDRFLVGIMAGLLVPLAGLNIPNTTNASLGQLYRGFAAVTF